jgi:hypothetical protein
MAEELHLAKTAPEITRVSSTAGPRCNFLRASLRARRIASAFPQTLFFEGGDYRTSSLVSRTSPLRPLLDGRGDFAIRVPTVELIASSR